VGTLAITGFQVSGGVTVVLQLYHIGGPGTYPLGVGPQVPGGAGILSSTTGGWSTPLSGDDGTLNITKLTSTEIAGTFSFTATPQPGSTGNRNVMNGEFNLQLNVGSNVGPLPDNAGSIVRATINGQPFNASAVAGNLIASNNTLSISGGNNVRTVSFVVTGVTGPGTYTLGPATAGRSLGMSLTNGQSWSTTQTGGSGTLTVTSITATRIRGTFSGTLGAFTLTGATGTFTLTNGTFDIGRP
jgi:hypothetical protein